MPLESVLHAARNVPHVWTWSQLAAACAALGYVWHRGRRRPALLACFAAALPAGAIGALALGFLYRLLDRLAGRETDLLGLAAFGALLGTAGAFAVLVKRRGLDVLTSLDVIAPALALLVGFGRLGCFFAGCDAGRVTASALSVRFPSGTALFRDHVAADLVLASDAWSLAVHPAQLYESAGAFVLAWLGARAQRRNAWKPGFVLGSIAAGYAALRAAADALRLPDANALYGIVTSLIVAGAGIALLLNSARTSACKAAPI